MKHLLLAAASGLIFGLITILVAESWLRVKLPPACALRHPLLHHTFRPNCQTTETNQDHSVTYKYNSLGLRGQDNLPPDTDKFRILMLGDSFTEGVGVDEKSIFSTLIENQTGAQVINAGVRKYAPLLEYLYLRDYGLAYQPDLVILNLNITDLIETDKYHQSIIANPSGKIVQITAPGRHFLPTEWRIFLWNNLRTYDYFQERIFPKIYILFHAAKSGSLKNNQKAVYSDRQFNMFSLSVDPLFKEEYQQIRAQVFSDINEIKNLTDQQQIPLLAVIQPAALHTSAAEWTTLNSVFNLPLKFPDDYPVDDPYHRDLSQYLESLNITTMDLTSIFRQNSTPSNPLFFPQDGHWNSRGHRLAADQIADFIQINYEL